MSLVTIWLVDLYDINTGEQVVGSWSLMDVGVWNGSPPSSSPSQLDAWSRVYLGFAAPVVVSGNLIGAKLPYVENVNANTNSLIYRVNLTDTEYFLLENREKSGYDAYQPYGGLAIWHIDETIFDTADNKVNEQSSTLHPGIAFISSDNKDHSDGKYVPFPGTDSDKTLFSPYTAPSSKSYYDPDVKSNIYVEKISAAGDTMTCNIITIPSYTGLAIDADTVLITVYSSYMPDTAFLYMGDTTVNLLDAGNVSFTMLKANEKYRYAVPLTIDSGSIRSDIYISGILLSDTLLITKTADTGGKIDFSSNNIRKITATYDRGTFVEGTAFEIAPAAVASDLSLNDTILSQPQPFSINYDSTKALDTGTLLLKIYLDTDVQSLASNKVGKIRLFKLTNNNSWSLFSQSAYSSAGNFVTVYGPAPGVYAVGFYTVSASAELSKWKGNTAFTYPNPVNFNITPTIHFNYNLPSDGNATLKIFDIAGHLIRVLYENKYKVSGLHREDYFNGRDADNNSLPPGMYLGVLRFLSSSSNVVYWKYFKIGVATK